MTAECRILQLGIYNGTIRTGTEYFCPNNPIPNWTPEEDLNMLKHHIENLPDHKGVVFLNLHVQTLREQEREVRDLLPSNRNIAIDLSTKYLRSEDIPIVIRLKAITKISLEHVFSTPHCVELIEKIRPHFVKVDYPYVKNTPKTVLKGLVDFFRKDGMKVIMVKVETREDFEKVLFAGALWEGFFEKHIRDVKIVP